MTARALLLPALMPLVALGGCATAMDDTRNGQPVTEITLSAIFDDPGAWEGKWVRISGWTDSKASILVSEKGDDHGWPTLHLDPKQKLAGRDSDSSIPNRAAVVSGQVDLTCARLFAEGYAALVAQGFVGGISAPEPGPNAYCNRAEGPNLVNVLVSKPASPRE